MEVFRRHSTKCFNMFPRETSSPQLHPGIQPSNNYKTITVCSSTGCRLLHSCRQRTLVQVTTGMSIRSLKAPKSQWPLMLPTAGLQVDGQVVKRPTGGQAHHPLGGRGEWGPAPVTRHHHILPCAFNTRQATHGASLADPG